MNGRHSAPGPRDNGPHQHLPPDFEITAAPAHGASRLPGDTLHANRVCYARAGRVILDDVTATARPGQALAIVGPSGSGKSSLLALLAGLEEPDSGTVQRDSTARVGLILQGYGLVGVLTAAENIEIALQAGAAGPMPPTEIDQRTKQALDAVGLAGLAGHLTEELSGGQQQRVAIARALAIDPAVILADELTAELDHNTKHHVVDLVLDVAHRGGTVVIATHDPDVAARCDRVVRIADGRLQPNGVTPSTYHG